MKPIKKTKLIATISAGVIILSAGITVAVLYFMQQSPESTQPQSVSELRQSGIDKVEQGNTEEGVSDLEKALDKARQEDDADAVAEIEQQIDFANQEPEKPADQPANTGQPDPNAITPTTEQGSSAPPAGTQ